MVVTGAVTVNAVAGGAADEVVRGEVSISIFSLSQECSADRHFPFRQVHHMLPPLPPHQHNLVINAPYPKRSRLEIKFRALVITHRIYRILTSLLYPFTRAVLLL